MRCPSCGGINSDRMTYCVHCGRDFTVQPSTQPGSRPQPPYQQQRQPPQIPQAPQPQVRPAGMPQQPYQQPRQAPPQAPQAPATQGRRTPAAPPQYAPNVRQPAPAVPPAPPPPEPPAPFPPRTAAELQALEPGALSYTVVDSAVGD